MRILLVGTGVEPIPPTGYGGVERTIAEFADALRRSGEEVTVLNQVRQGRSLDEYWFALALRRLLRDARYDIVHASTPVVANRLAGLGIPYVYTTHSRHWFERAGFRERFGFGLERRAVRHARATVALTDRLARVIRSEVPDGGRLEVIPIGVDTDRFHPSWDRRRGDRVLGVGVVRPFKRWEVAAAALRGTGARLTIAGPTPDADYARRVQSAGDQVEIAGEVDQSQLEALYAESDLLVHPSRVELLAGAVIQGLAAGLPVVGAEPVAGLFEEGVSGFGSPPGADDAAIEAVFARSVRLLLSDPARRRAMGEAARGVAVGRFSWAAVVGRHQALYRELRVGPAA